MTHKVAPGVIFDHGVRSPEELNLDIIAMAMNYGFEPELTTEVESLHKAVRDEDDLVYVRAVERLAEIANRSEEFLNKSHCPDGYWIGNDGEAGAFGCWLIDEQSEPFYRDGECGVTISFGGSVDPYSASCELEEGHNGDHAAPHPLSDSDGDQIKWSGGGTCAGDPLPFTFTQY